MTLTRESPSHTLEIPEELSGDAGDWLMAAFTVCPVRFNADDPPVHRRVKSESSFLEPGATVHVEVGADWNSAVQVDLDWYWVECIVIKADLFDLHVRVTEEARSEK